MNKKRATILIVLGIFIIIGIILVIVGINLSSGKIGNNLNSEHNISESSEPIKIIIDQKDSTVDEIKQDISGSIESDEPITSIYWENRCEIDKYSSVYNSGNAEVKNGKWKIEKLLLKLKNNRITIIAKTSSGLSVNKELNLNFNMGEHYTLDKKNIVESEEGSYVNNIIVLTFAPNTLDEEKEKVVKSINGRVAGENKLLCEYQVEIAPTNLKGLKAICKQIEDNFEYVLFARIDYLAEFERSIEETTVPNDSWKKQTQGNQWEDWNEEKPNGNNWWAEAIQVLSAWKYNNKFRNITIGVVDSGFDIEHEDLKINVINESVNEKDEHGTHVAGIIGATANNDIGITGIVWNKELIGYDSYYDGAPKTSLFQGIVASIACGSKVVNLSSGAKEPIADSEEIDIEANYAAWYIMWISEFIKDDFIIVQAAGNNTVNAITNGYFSSITKESAQKTIEKHSKDFKQKFKIEDILDRVIIVGAVGKASKNYKLLYTIKGGSNYGPQISVTAPGEEIFSTVVNTYKSIPGTSMAAPMVTGVASLVWSVNFDFTPGEVKEIVCNYTKDDVKSNYVFDKRTYRMVNAKLAVEEAIKRTPQYKDEIDDEIDSNCFKWIIEPSIEADDIQPLRTDLPNGFDSVYQDGFNYGKINQINRNGSNGGINYNGKIVIPCKKNIRPCLEGIVSEGEDDFYDEDGNRIGGGGGHGGNWYYYDITKLSVCELDDTLEFEYLSPNQAINPITPYCIGVIQTTGRPDPNYPGMNYPEYNKLSSYVYLDSNDKPITKIQFTGATQFRENLAAVKKDNKWGFINELGEIVIPLKYDYAYSFENGIAAVCKNGKWGYIDKENNTVIDFEFEATRPHYKGQAWVKQNGKWGVIEFSSLLKPTASNDFQKKEETTSAPVKLKHQTLESNGVKLVGDLPVNLTYSVEFEYDKYNNRYIYIVDTTIDGKEYYPCDTDSNVEIYFPLPQHEFNVIYFNLKGGKANNSMVLKRIVEGYAIAYYSGSGGFSIEYDSEYKEDTNF